jgi:hypothetical protein
MATLPWQKRPRCYGATEPPRRELCDGCIYHNLCRGEADAVARLMAPVAVVECEPNPWLLFMRWLVEHNRVGPKGR